MDDLLRIRFVELRPEDRNCYFYSKWRGIKNLQRRSN
jgi:hypothetical protein